MEYATKKDRQIIGYIAFIYIYISIVLANTLVTVRNSKRITELEKKNK